MHYDSSVTFLTEGRLDVTKDGLKVLTIEPEDMFGELSLLYNCTHTYSVSGRRALCEFLGFCICMQVSLDMHVSRTLVNFNCNSF